MKYAESVIVRSSNKDVPVTANFAPPPVHEGGYLKSHYKVPPHDTCDVYTKENLWNIQKA
jgi:hypothetical protein